jgi:hypothetical protein
LSDTPIPAPEDPDDLVARGRAVRYAATVIGIAAIFLLVFNATALRNWSAALRPTDLNVQMAAVAGGWRDTLARFGLDAPRALIHDAWAKARALTFSHGEAPAGADGPPPG